MFSPRDPAKVSSVTLQWYADRMAEAQEIACITLAFHLDKVFSAVIAQDNNVLRYIVKDDDLRDSETIGQDRDVIWASGGFFEDGGFGDFVIERGNPLNTNDNIHNKFLLVDPLKDEPLVVTGSANFSQPSQTTNDESMLVICGDTRVADIYFGEYMRIFDHHYARYIVRKLGSSNKSDPNAGYLRVQTSAWLDSHFDQHSYKSKRRRYFAGF